MDCPACQDRLLDWLDSDLDPTAAEAVEGHLADCAACAPEAFDLIRTRRLLGEAVRPPAPAGSLERLRAAVAREPATARPARWRPPAGMAAAAVLLAALAGWRLAPPRTEVETRVVERPVRVVEFVEVPAATDERPPAELWSTGLPARRPRPAGSDPAPASPVRSFWTASLTSTDR